MRLFLLFLLLTARYAITFFSELLVFFETNDPFDGVTVHRHYKHLKTRGKNGKYFETSTCKYNL